jgi:diguanylate cyclase (GGDEF)-like protein/PAS domain S-box-containing protein
MRADGEAFTDAGHDRAMLRLIPRNATLVEPGAGAPPDAHSLPVDAYRALADQAPLAMLVVRGHRIRYANAASAELFGYSQAELLAGMQPTDLTAPEGRDRISEQISERLSGLQPGAQIVEGRRKDGSVFPARVWAQRAALDGKPADLVTLQDISETAQALHVARRRDHLLAQTEELALSGACEYEVATGLVTQSAGMFRIFGEPVTDAPVTGEWLLARVPAAESAFVSAILEGVRPGLPCEFEHRILRADGSVRTVIHRSLAEVDAHARTSRIISILQDITAQRAAEQQRDRLAQSDTVTGLQNRSSFIEHLSASLRHAARNDRPLSLLLIQINQFKLVSDSLGLAGGDQLLAAVSDRMSALVSATDTLAHLGSGQFALLPSRREGADEALAVALAEALVAGFATAFVIDDTEVSVTCGIGIAAFPRDADGAEKLLHQAQAAMLRANELGDNQIRTYTPDTHAKAARSLALQAGLRRALERGEFHLHYQPQVDLTHGRLVGVEALLRWTDAGGRVISPAEFIPLAEETGLILPIGDWVLRTACAQNLAWQRAGLPPLRMAVNLSMRQLQQPDIARRVQAVLMETGLEARWLGVEITENVLMGESTHVAGMLHAMKSMGIEISLDDFGTGYSNLNYLSKLPIDVVKVDRSFVHDIGAPAQAVSMTRAVITMAHSLHMKVLAEGVETEGQLALLIAHRCDQMQGYYFSRPIPAEAVAGLLREGRCLPEDVLRRKKRRRSLLLVGNQQNFAAG